MRDFPLNAEDLLHMRKVDKGIQGVVAPDPADRDPPMACIGRLILTSVCGQIQGLNVALPGWLVPLDGEDKVGISFGDEVLSTRFLGQERIRRDHLLLDLQFIE